MGTKHLFGYTRGKLEFNWKRVFISLNKRQFSIYLVLYRSLREGLLNSNCGDISISAMQDRIALSSFFFLNIILHNALIVGTNDEWGSKGTNDGGRGERDVETLSHRHDFSWTDAAPTRRLQLTTLVQQRSKTTSFNWFLSAFHLWCDFTKLKKKKSNKQVKCINPPRYNRICAVTRFSSFHIKQQLVCFTWTA